MKYTTEVTINLPRERVIELMDTPENMTHWQPTLLRYTLLDDDPKAEGARMEMVYEERGGEQTITETIIKYNMPDEFIATYTTDGVYNKQVNHFYDEGNQTRWVSETEFRFESLMMKVIGFVMRGAFPNQTRETMENFKQFAEQNA